MTTRPSRFTRTGIRRSGDDYQDLCALELLIEMLEHPKRFRWAKVEADEAGVLDDVLALREDGTYVARQVKYAGHPDEDSDPWTWDRFLQARELHGKASASLLLRWFRSWRKISGLGRIADASLESNRRAGDGIREILHPDGTVPFDHIPEGTSSEIVRQFGDESEARAFFSEFKFRVDRADLDVLDGGLSRRFYTLGGTDEGWLSLKDQLRLWVRERHQPSSDGSITLADVRAAAKWYRLATLPQDLAVPEDYILPSKAFHDDFLLAVLRRRYGCLVLAAPPALGKSTYLSYLVSALQRAGVPVVRHHYLLRVGDRTRGRLDYRRVAESLMGDLSAAYPDALGDLGTKNPDPDQLGDWIEKAGAHFMAQGTVLVVVIDGLDHVWRERRSRDELNRLFEHLIPVPNGVVLVVGTQPVDDALLPRRLLSECPRERWIRLEALDRDAVAA